MQCTVRYICIHTDVFMYICNNVRQNVCMNVCMSVCGRVVFAYQTNAQNFRSTFHAAAHKHTYTHTQADLHAKKFVQKHLLFFPFPDLQTSSERRDFPLNFALCGMQPENLHCMLPCIDL